MLVQKIVKLRKVMRHDKDYEKVVYKFLGIPLYVITFN